LTAKKPENPAYPKELITLGDHIRKRRLDLGLRQKSLLVTLGVSESTVNNWEMNRYAPKTYLFPRIFAFLGYIPSPYDKKSDNIIEQIKLYRLTHGLSQKKFAKLVGVDETTVAKWERGEQEPSKSKTKNLLFLSVLARRS
jgi:DNA-binding transcriptional regulator YiaG